MRRVKTSVLVRHSDTKKFERPLWLVAHIMSNLAVLIPTVEVLPGFSQPTSDIEMHLALRADHWRRSPNMHSLSLHCFADIFNFKINGLRETRNRKGTQY